MPLSGFRESWGTGLVFAVAVILQLLVYDPELNLYDEGIILVGAEQVFGGALPYKDFWTLYGPGQFYLTSWLFSLIGVSDFAARVPGIASKAAITTLSYLVIGQVTQKGIAATGALVTAAMLIGMRQDAFPVFPALALSMGAILLVVRSRAERPTHLFAAGVCTGLAALFRHDLGAYNAAAIVSVLWIVTPRRSQIGQGGPRAAASGIGVYALGVLLVVAPIAIYFFHAVPFGDLYEDLIGFPSRIYPAMRSLAFPGLGELRNIFSQRVTDFAVYVPFVVGAGVLWLETYGKRQHMLRLVPEALGQRMAWVVPLLAVTSLIFTLKGLVRVSNIHMVQSLVLSVALICVTLTRLDLGVAAGRLYALFVILPASIPIAVMAGQGLMIAAHETSKAGEPGGMMDRCMNPPSHRAPCVTFDGDYVNAAEFVKSRSNSADSIYVGAMRHDKVFISAVAFYFVAERRPATKWYELHPGLQTRADVQTQMVAEMKGDPPRLVVLDSRWDGVQEANDSSRSTGVRLLDDYFVTHYFEVQRFGSIRILARR